MGGSGSGRWQNRGRGTVEEHHRLDVRILHRAGALAPGTTSQLRANEQISIGMEAEDSRLLFRYTVGVQGSSEREDIEEWVSVSWTSCNYGGGRPWFRCPQCSRRVAILYPAGRRFLLRCRHCAKLSYNSQREIRTDRLLRRAQRIWERLDWGRDERGYPPKPKGMHWATYDRLVTEAEGLETLEILLSLSKVSLFRRRLGHGGAQLLVQDTLRLEEKRKKRRRV